VKMSQLQPGDLIFSRWGNEQGAGHVSIYIGHGHIVEAAGQGIPVRVASQASQGGNPAAAAAALQAMRPLQVSPVQQPMQAQTAVQNLIASHQSQQTMIPNASPPEPSLMPTSNALASSLSALHTRLLEAPKRSPIPQKL
jgi:hypothetical protein